MRMIMANTPKEPKYRSRFVAKLEFMEGDADGTEYVYLVYDTVDELEDLQTTLDWLRNEDSYGRLGAYNTTPDKMNRIMDDPRFIKHFGRSDDTCLCGAGDDWQKCVCSFECFWPFERDGNGPMSFQGVEYSWWDSRGAEYAIIVERGA